LIRSQTSGEATAEDLRATLTDLEARLDQRAAEFTRAKVDLAAFSVNYRAQVGRLHEELDELQFALAEAELIEISQRVKAEPGQRTAPSAPQFEPPARFTSDAVRRLFRDVAKMVHPDLAADEATRDRRHALMIEANRAYAVGDEARLRWVLDAWARRPDAIRDSDPAADRDRLARRITEVEEELTACTAALAALRQSPMMRLQIMVDEAAVRGKDLIADMVRRLKRDILVARNRLDAMRWSR
jgi:hypothetical protein